MIFNVSGICDEAVRDKKIMKSKENMTEIIPVGDSVLLFSRPCMILFFDGYSENNEYHTKLED